MAGTFLGASTLYVAVPVGKTFYLSELAAGEEVTMGDLSGKQRTAIVGRVKIESRPLILVQAKDAKDANTAIPVTSLKVGVEVVLRLQGGAHHTGIDIQ